MDNSGLENIVVSCSRWAARQLKTEGYHIQREVSQEPPTFEFRVTDKNQFLDRFLTISNKEGSRE